MKPLLIFLLLLGILFIWFVGELFICRAEHFNDEHLLTPRELVREACRQNLNPFRL